MTTGKETYWNSTLECMKRPQLAEHQLSKLREQLFHVNEHSPFYWRKLAGAGIRPEQIRTMEDVRNIPFTTKGELKESQLRNPPWGDFGCIDPSRAVRVFQTSGTTGTPVRVMLSGKDWLETYSEQFQYYRCAYGITNKDTLYVPFSYGLYLAWWGFHMAMEQAGLMIVPGGGQTSKDRLRAIFDWGATVVCGTPTYLLYLAETARKMGIDLADSPVRKLVAAGEPGAAIPASKKAMEAQWGAECFDDIGSTEISNFAYECTAHQGTHVNEAMFIAEAVCPDTLEPVADGEVGELILTNLYCESMPLIRYRTGDLVRIGRGRCACGRTALRLDGGVLGRADDMFHFAGVNVFPGQIQNLLHEVDAFSQEYQLVVPAMGSGRRLRIRVEPANETVNSQRLKSAVDQLVESVRYRITVTPEIEVAEIGSIPRVEGKARRIIREEA